jgi:hypothetical protein
VRSGIASCGLIEQVLEMSNYQRNTSMVACIFAVLIVGAVSIGLIAYYGTDTWNWNINPATTDFHFESEVGTINETVTLDLDVSAGGISVVFVDNESLLFDIDIEVTNTTLESEEDPVVTFASNTISLDYPAAGVNVTLGSGVNYTLNIQASAGGVSVVLGDGAHVGDVTISVSAGGVSLVLTDDAVLLGSPDFEIEASAGGISLTIDLPAGIGGSLVCYATTGGVDITATGWNRINSNHYKTSDYDTATQALTIVAECSAGGISAVLT